MKYGKARKSLQYPCLQRCGAPLSAAPQEPVEWTFFDFYSYTAHSGTFQNSYGPKNTTFIFFSCVFFCKITAIKPSDLYLNADLLFSSWRSRLLEPHCPWSRFSLHKWPYLHRFLWRHNILQNLICNQKSQIKVSFAAQSMPTQNVYTTLSQKCSAQQQMLCSTNIVSFFLSTVFALKSLLFRPQPSTPRHNTITLPSTLCLTLLLFSLPPLPPFTVSESFKPLSRLFSLTQIVLSLEKRVTYHPPSIVPFYFPFTAQKHLLSYFFLFSAIVYGRPTRNETFATTSHLRYLHFTAACLSSR